MPDQLTSDTADDPALPAGTREVLAQGGWTLRARPGAAGGYVVRDDRGDECTVDRVAVPADPAARTRLVEHLHATNAHLLVTTNYAPSELAVRLGRHDPISGERIVSRLVENAIQVNLDRADLRAPARRDDDW